MSEAIVRAAVPADIPDILRLLRELAEYERKPETVNIDAASIERYVFSPEACAEVVLAHSGDRAVSYAIFFPFFSSFRGRPWLYLEDLYVTAAARGQGVGRRMMQHLARLALRRGWAGMCWGVLEWNAPAFAFYESLGAVRGNEPVAMQIDGEPLLRLAQGD